MAVSQRDPAEFAVFDGDLDDHWTARYLQVATLAVDTEAMGLIHGRDRLCLVQIADEHDRVCCVRIGLGQHAAPNLQRVLEAQSVEKIFHFARFDVAALASGLGINVAPLFCTKVGSRLARTYTPRHGLKDLVMELVGVELDKGAQSSDWGRVDELTDASWPTPPTMCAICFQPVSAWSRCCGGKGAGIWRNAASSAFRW